MEIFISILIGLLFLIIWSYYNEKNNIQKLKIQFKNEWGDVPSEEYTSEKFQSLQAYYNEHMDDRLDVDDITWNDVDMDQIFMLINNTKSSMGEEYLYAMLRKPSYSVEELKERDRIIKLFQSQESKRIELQVALAKIGKLRTISVYEYINRLNDLEQKSNIPHYIMAFGLIASLIFVFVNPPLGGFLTLAFITNNILRYYKRKAEIELYLSVFSLILRLLEGVKGISKLDIPELKEYFASIKQEADVFKSFQRGAGMLTSKSVTGNITDIFIDYFRMLFHVDIMKFNSMLQFLKKNRDTLNQMFEKVGFLDSMIAAASFREMMDYTCEPELVKDTKPRIEVTDLYHPLIESPVTNSIKENRSVLITGSNASGKSTFIKTLAINAILSQSIYTAIATSYKASFFQIYSSMALRDSIFQKESYYIVEIKSLKRILDRVNPEIPTLCFVDEVLRGTNTLERIAASSRILASLAQNNTLIFAATHDIELTHILEKYYSNYHFQEQIKEDRIIFDYKLYPGRAVSKNAIKLLRLLGYSDEIIQSAEQAAEQFQTTGEWINIT
ncbi:MAG: hypothetical protein K0S47_1713 [Herbinix sp.]|jgi:DNA mismatch repair ATPase MutS|nr:hypothetical protein [Herbinix sp.]